MNTNKLILVAVFILTIGADAQVLAAGLDTRGAIALKSRAFMDAIERGDPRAVAELFTEDAKLIVSGATGVIAGRGAIEHFWQSALSNGVKDFRLTTIDLEGEGSLQIETGTYQALGAEGSDLGRGHYLFVWKMDNGTWKIHRDIASAKSAQTSASVPATAAEDRNGFPVDYRSVLQLLSVAVKNEEPSVMTVFGNDFATSIINGTGPVQYPYGTMIAMEFAHGVRDGENQLLYDADGSARKAEVARIDVMRRGPGYGAAYGESRAGEWEFASYRPDGSTLLAPEDAAACAACHRKAGSERDFVYRRHVPAAQR